MLTYMLDKVGAYFLSEIFRGDEFFAIESGIERYLFILNQLHNDIHTDTLR